jgi:hypothetical protein
MSDHYFIVLDEAPIKGSPTPKYELMFGNIKTAVGFHVTDRRNNDIYGKTMKELLHHVPKGFDVYRVYIHRTDGKTGYKLIRGGK